MSVGPASVGLAPAAQPARPVAAPTTRAQVVEQPAASPLAPHQPAPQHSFAPPPVPPQPFGPPIPHQPVANAPVSVPPVAAAPVSAVPVSAAPVAALPLPQRVPAPPDVPEIPDVVDDPYVEPGSPSRAGVDKPELARIATGLRYKDDFQEQAAPPPEGFDFEAVLTAVRRVPGVRDAALKPNVKLGAHPSYPDRENFGRVSLAIAPDALRASLITQLDALRKFAPLHHVKPQHQTFACVCDSGGTEVADFPSALSLCRPGESSDRARNASYSRACLSICASNSAW